MSSTEAKGGGEPASGRLTTAPADTSGGDPFDNGANQLDWEGRPPTAKRQWVVEIDFSIDDRIMSWLRGAILHGTLNVEHETIAVARFTVTATSLRAATMKAFSRISDATPEPASKRILAIRAKPLGHNAHLPELVGLSEIASMFGVTRQRVGQLTCSVGFPSPVANLAMGPVFVRHGVEEFARANGRTVQNRSPRRRV